MATIIIKIDEKKSLLKTVLSLLNKVAKQHEGIEIVEVTSSKSAYTSEFVKKIKKAEKEKGIEVDPKDVWGSLGLK
jgi:NOL1/NOP2/fmu family ribosome biogenesis protein